MSALEYQKELSYTLGLLDTQKIDACVSVIADSLLSKKKILTCGNGGSALTASHYVTDWVKSPLARENGPLNILCLCDNLGLVTAYANDIAYKSVFSEQVKVFGHKGDVLVLVSGSGNSKNMIEAAEIAKIKNVITIAVVGFDGGTLGKICDHLFHVPSFNMQICEDLHLMFGHVVMKKLSQ